MTIEPDPARLCEAREWASEAAAEAGLHEPDRYLIKLAISEAVSNAIQHGSPSSGGEIRIAVFEADGSIVFEVSDQGTFVAPRAAPTDDDETGRGLELLTSIMDELHISSTGAGSLVRLVKRLD